MLLVLAACGSGKGNDKAAAPANKWPEKNVTIIVPYPAGGSTDLTFRTLAEQMKNRSGRTLSLLTKKVAAAVSAPLNARFPNLTAIP